MSENDSGLVTLLVHGSEDADEDITKHVKDVEKYYSDKNSLEGVFWEAKQDLQERIQKIKEGNGRCVVVFLDKKSINVWMRGTITGALKVLIKQKPTVFAAYNVDEDLVDFQKELKLDNLDILNCAKFQELTRKVDSLLENNVDCDTQDGGHHEESRIEPEVESVTFELESSAKDNNESVQDGNSDDFRYPIKYLPGKKVGLCLIISMTQFEHKDIEDRLWSFSDLRKMQDAFSYFGFEILEKRNCTANEALEFFVKGQEKCRELNPDVFACVISTHGEEIEESEKDHQKSDQNGSGDQQENNRNSPKTVYSKIQHRLIFKEGKPVNTTEIVDKFNDDNCPSLKHKPRLFFIQACSSRVRPLEKNTDMGTEICISKRQEPAETESKQEEKITESDRSQTDTIDAKGKRMFPAATLTSGDQQRHVPRNANLESSSQHASVPQSPGMDYEGTTATTETLEEYKVEMPSIPCFMDSLIMFASPPGQVAFSREGHGGWLIKCLNDHVNEFKKRNENGEFDLIQELTRVSYKMAFDMEVQKIGYKCVPCIRHMLTKDVILCPKFSC